MDPREVAKHWEGNAETWTQQARGGFDVFRDLVNTPAFLQMLPAVNGLRGLDIGCGEGSNTRQLARRGARMMAIDIAPTFIRHAQEQESADPLGIEFRVGDAMSLPFASGCVDFVTAFMSLMDMPEPARALTEAHRVLRPGGFVQFSILHPCFITPHRKVIRGRDGKASAVEIGDYFESTDGRVDSWWFTTVGERQREAIPPFQTPIFHRTLTEWISTVLSAGFAIEQVAEPTATAHPALFGTAVDEARVAPLSLQMRTRKAR